MTALYQRRRGDREPDEVGEPIRGAIFGLIFEGIVLTVLLVAALWGTEIIRALRSL